MLIRLKQLITKLEDNNLLSALDQSLSLRSSSRHFGPSLSTLGFLAATLSGQPHPVSAETFDQASTNELRVICGFGQATPGSELRNICGRLNLGGQGGNAGTAASSGVGTQSQPSSLLISQQQLKDAQTQKEKQDRPKSGSPDAVTASWGDKFSTFLTTGASTLRHRNNDFEQGYDATIPSVTLGGGYSISKSLETGLAFNYSNSNADFNTGGGFNVDSYSPLLYVNYLPFDNAFANLALGYTRQNQSIDRLAVAGFAARTGELISSFTKGNLNANQYTLNFLSGYDYAIENITIGPRLGVDVRQWEMAGYQESTNTGLELSYNSQQQTSVQSTLGLFASSAHSFSYGVLVPQLTASWVHEYENNSRTITAQFVQAPTSDPFQFQTESPARDWAVVDLGVSFVMPRGVQAFANLSTVQGNRNFESYGGNLGVRIGW